MTLKGGTSQACAACKYQRKRCTPECALAPHFQPEQTKIFKNAHKLFGVRNILRILEQIDPAQKTEAMRSIIYQANMRDRFPVHGCYGIICQLHFQLRQAEEELHAVLSQLSIYKQQENMSSLTPPNDTSTSQLQLGMGMGPPNTSNAALTLFQQDTTTVTVTPQEQLQLQFNPVEALPISSFHTYSGNGNGNGNGGHNSAGYIDSKEHVNVANALWGQQQTYCNGNNENMALMPLQSQLVNSQSLTIQAEEATQDYDKIHPFFDTIDDRQSYIDSKEAYDDSSSDSSPKDTTKSLEHVADNELKSAELQLGIISEEYLSVA